MCAFVNVCLCVYACLVLGCCVVLRCVGRCVCAYASSSKLAHPHLVRIFGLVRNPGSCVAEFIDGGTLDSYLEDEVRYLIPLHLSFICYYYSYHEFNYYYYHSFRNLWYLFFNILNNAHSRTTSLRGLCVSVLRKR